MPEPFLDLLDATILHVQWLKKNGVKFVALNGKDAALVETQCLEFATETHGQPQAILRTAPPLSPTNPALPLNKAEALLGIRERALVCQKCAHLAASRKSVVFGIGNLDAELMFVGEAPGVDEDRLGEPFVGKAGETLTRIITAMGFTRETVYIANVLKCRPDTPGKPWGNRPPTLDEMQTCLPYLQAQIDLIQPKAIVALGATAVKGLTGTTEGISRLRGQFQKFRNIPLMPTYHPAYLLRKEDEGREVVMAEKRKVWEDMLQVLELLGKTITEKQRKFFT